MISMTTRPATRPHPAPRRNWRLAAGLAGAAAGAVILAGAFLPWVETFAGLIGIPGVRGSNGRILVAAGILIAVAGLWHAVRGGSRSRWLVGIGGFAALGFSGYLLIQLAATLRTLGGDSMVLARGGPGLWVSAGGSLLAFATFFLPSSAAAPAAGAPPRPSALRAGAARIGRSVLARTADMESRGARRRLQIVLGLVWLLDGVLQLQPALFGPRFASMLGDTATGNPAVLAGPILQASRLVGHDAVAWNTAFALIQLAIAAGLLWRPTVKAALAGSVAWSLAVWWLGEGLGGLLTGTASPVTGAPGAVILYALLAALVWPARSSDPGRNGIASVSLLGSRGSRAAWLVLWGGFAYLVMQPAVRAPGGLRGALAANAAGEPGWLAAMDRATAAAIGAHGAVVCVVLAVLFAAIAAGILHPVTTRPALAAAAVAGLAFWVAGENFGQMLTGTATDPNTGPLLVLLAAAYWPRWRRQARPAVAAPCENDQTGQGNDHGQEGDPGALRLRIRAGRRGRGGPLLRRPQSGRGPGGTRARRPARTARSRPR